MKDLNFDRYIHAVTKKNRLLESGTPADTIRKEGTRLLEENMLNSKFNETWRFTDLSGVIKRDLMPYDENRAGITQKEEDLITGSIDTVNTIPIVFINGQLWQKSLELMEKEPHLTVSSVLDMFNAPKLETPYSDMLQSADFDWKDPFFAMNLADLNDGLRLDITGPCNPLHMLYYFNSDTHNCVSSLRHFVVIESGFHASVFETILEQDNVPHTVNLLRQMVLRENSSLDHITAFSPGRKTFLFNHTEIDIGQSAHLYSAAVNSGGLKTRNNQNLKLTGSDSSLYSGGFYLTAGNEQIDNYTDISHRNHDSTSTQLFKGILTDTSHAVFRGKISISKDVKRADSSQLNRNIVLSEHAHINSMPWLEIDSDDVKCSHGSATGSVDPEEIFYLTSRGIPESQAKDMILSAFAQEITEFITDKTIRSKTRAVISGIIDKSIHLQDRIL